MGDFENSKCVCCFADAFCLMCVVLFRFFVLCLCVCDFENPKFDSNDRCLCVCVFCVFVCARAILKFQSVCLLCCVLFCFVRCFFFVCVVLCCFCLLLGLCVRFWKLPDLFDAFCVCFGLSYMYVGCLFVRMRVCGIMKIPNLFADLLLLFLLCVGSFVLLCSVCVCVGIENSKFESCVIVLCVCVCCVFVCVCAILKIPSLCLFCCVLVCLFVVCLFVCVRF